MKPLMAPKETTACNATTTDELYDFLSKDQDTTLLDLEWMAKGLNFVEEDGTYDIEKNWSNPHDMKPDLRAQWGLSGKDNILYTDDVNLPQSIVKKASKDEIMKDCITKTARSMMNGGRTKKEIVTAIASRLASKEEIQRYASHIHASLEGYGATGRFMVDATGYKGCREAMVDAEKSKWKKNFGFIRNCNCHNKIRVASENTVTHGGSFQSLFEDGNVRVASATYDVCPVSGLRVFAGASDIDEQWAGDTGFDMMNASGADLPKEGKSVIASAVRQNPFEGLVALCTKLDDACPCKNNQIELGDQVDFGMDVRTCPVQIDMGNGPSTLDGDVGFELPKTDEYSVPVDEFQPSLDGAVKFDTTQNDDYFSGCQSVNFDFNDVPAEHPVDFTETNMQTDFSPLDVENQKIMDIEMGIPAKNTVKDEDYFSTATGGIIEVEKNIDAPIVSFGLGKSSPNQMV